MGVLNLTTALIAGPGGIINRLPEQVGYTPSMPTLDACNSLPNLQPFPLGEFPLTSWPGKENSSLAYNFPAVFLEQTRRDCSHIIDMKDKEKWLLDTKSSQWGNFWVLDPLIWMERQPEVKSNKIHRQWLVRTRKESLFGHHFSPVSYTDTLKCTVSHTPFHCAPSQTFHHSLWIHILSPANPLAVPLKILLFLQPSQGMAIFPSPQMISSLSTTPFSFLLPQSLKLLSCVYSKQPCPSLSLLKLIRKKTTWVKPNFLPLFYVSVEAENYVWGQKHTIMLI